MSPTIKYIIGQSLFTAALVGWIGYGIDGAKHIALFLFWLSIALTPIVFTSEAGKAFRKSRIPAGLSGAIDVCYIASLAWAGAVVTAVFYALHSILSHGAKGYWRDVKPEK